MDNGAPAFEVESVLAKRAKGSRAEYLVKWLGYPDWESTWEPAAALNNAREAVAAYEHQLQSRDSDHTLHLMTSRQARELEEETPRTNTQARDSHSTAPARLHPKDDDPNTDSRSHHPSRLHLSAPSNYDTRRPSALGGGMLMSQVAGHPKVKHPDPSPVTAPNRRGEARAPHLRERTWCSLFKPDGHSAVTSARRSCSLEHKIQQQQQKSEHQQRSSSSGKSFSPVNLHPPPAALTSVRGWSSVDVGCWSKVG